MPLLSRKRKVVSYNEGNDEEDGAIEGVTGNDDNESQNEAEGRDEEQPADEMITEEDTVAAANAETEGEDDEQVAGDGENVEQPCDSDGLEDDLHTPHEEEDNIDVTPRLPSKRKIKRRKLHTGDCPKNPSRRLFGSSKKKRANDKRSSVPSPHIREQCRKRKQGFQNREIEEQGVWVQCEDSECKKWRFIRSETDPANLHPEWTCDMHPDEKYNSCDKPEEDYSQLEFIHAGFTEGSVVWARVQGYPWWPAMIETDPDSRDYMMHDGMDSHVTHYHCVFLDKTVSRSWVPVSSVEKFEASGKPPGTCFKKRRDYSKQIVHARERALDALKLSIKERIHTYGFSKTFKGSWAPATSDDGESIQGLEEDDVDEEVADILGSLLSTEDMEELKNQTEDVMPDAVEALKEMDKQQKPKGARKTKPSRAKPKAPKQKGPKNKREKRRKHESRHDKHGDEKKQKKHKRHEEKERRKEELLKKMIANKDEADTTEKMDSDNDDKVIGKSRAENEEVQSSEKSDGSKEHVNRAREASAKDKEATGALDWVSPDSGNNSQVDPTVGPQVGEGDDPSDKASSQSSSPRVEEGDKKSGDEKETTEDAQTSDDGKGDFLEKEIGGDLGGKQARNDGENEQDRSEEAEAGNDGKDEAGAEDGGDNSETKESALSKTEKKKKREEREENRRLIQEARERKAKEKGAKRLLKDGQMKEKEEKRLLKEQQMKERELLKEQQMKEKEEKRKAKELKKEQREQELKEKDAKKKEKELQKLKEKEAKELKKKEREEKKAKRAARGGKGEKGTSKGSSKGESTKGGSGADGDKPPAKKPKFSAPKGKPKAFVAPVQVAESKEGDCGKEEKPKKCDGALQEGDSTSGKEVAENGKSPADSNMKTEEENAAPMENRIVPNVRVSKAKKKKFCVKRKEEDTKDNVKGNSTDEKISGPLEKKSKLEPVAVLDTDVKEVAVVVSDLKEEGGSAEEAVTGESLPTGNVKQEKDAMDENDGDSLDLDWSEAPVKATSPVGKVSPGRVVDGDIPRKAKVSHQDQDQMNDDGGDDFLDLDWSEAPVKSTSPAKKVTSAVDEDSDPFETVEE